MFHKILVENAQQARNQEKSGLHHHCTKYHVSASSIKAVKLASLLLN
jgi:hypothetical protein